MHREPARRRAGTVNGEGHVAAQESEVKKSLNCACAALMLSMSAFAHAQGSAAPNGATPAMAPGAAAQAAAAPADPAWNSDGTAHITRAQVRHELVEAEQDGQLKLLNSTVYAHH